MNNFYKPSYSRGQKRSAIQSRQAGSRNMKRDSKKVPDQKLREDIGNLETDHNILLHRRNVFTAQNFQQQTSQQLIKTSNLPKKPTGTRFNQTAKQGFRKNVERPQSKQEPRVKGWNTSGLLLKSTLPQTNRPRTSKGQRPKIAYKQKFDDISKRRTSLQNDDFKIFRISNEIEKKKREIPNSSASSRKGSQSNRIQFKTSIDPQFLSLFAN